MAFTDWTWNVILRRELVDSSSKSKPTGTKNESNEPRIVIVPEPAIAPLPSSS